MTNETDMLICINKTSVIIIQFKQNRAIVMRVYRCWTHLSCAQKDNKIYLTLYFINLSCNTMSRKISIGYTNLDRDDSRANLAVESAFS